MEKNNTIGIRSLGKLVLPEEDFDFIKDFARSKGIQKEIVLSALIMFGIAESRPSQLNAYVERVREMYSGDKQ